MTLQARGESILLLIGDALFLVLGLWLTLLVRYFDFPDRAVLLSHLEPFVWIFVAWLVIFFISDLYGKQNTIWRRRLVGVIIRAQIANLLVAVVFFYFIPGFRVAPRVNLFIYFLIATGLLVWWRLGLSHLVLRGRRERLAFLGTEPELLSVKRELTDNLRYRLDIVEVADLAEARRLKPGAIVVNIYGREVPVWLADFYRLLFAGVRFLPLHRLYEDIFGQIPVSVISERWFLENISNRRRVAYDSLKRLMDIVLATLLFVITLPLYPVIWLAIKLDDGGPLFFSQERVGRHQQVFTIHKFRSMRGGEVTRVGRFIRRTRLDELPQLRSVITGRQSLVGPRPERPDYAAIYREKIPYYDARHLIAPGLSGWAQIYHQAHPHFRPMVDDTRDKLSYDLYYVKNRGMWLDLEIALKTIKTILSRTGL
ncbi:MAG: sugar transferase [Patescibacteria group bacterium]